MECVSSQISYVEALPHRVLDLGGEASGREQELDGVMRLGPVIASVPLQDRHQRASTHKEAM